MNVKEVCNAIHTLSIQIFIVIKKVKTPKQSSECTGGAQLSSLLENVSPSNSTTATASCSHCRKENQIVINQTMAQVTY